MAERVADGARVLFISPEVVAQERRAEVVRRHGDGSPDELIDKLDALGTIPGEYRLDENPDQADGVPGTSVRGGVVQVSGYGARLVWVDDAPDDPEDGNGHFEVYDASEHGSPYSPVPSRSVAGDDSEDED